MILLKLWALSFVVAASLRPYVFLKVVKDPFELALFTLAAPLIAALYLTIVGVLIALALFTRLIHR